MKEGMKEGRMGKKGRKKERKTDDDDDDEEILCDPLLAPLDRLPAKRGLNDDRDPVCLELPGKFLTSVTEPAVKGILHQLPLKSQLTCCLLAVNQLSVGGQPAYFTLT